MYKYKQTYADIYIYMGLHMHMHLDISIHTDSVLEFPMLYP